MGRGRLHSVFRGVDPRVNNQRGEKVMNEMPKMRTEGQEFKPCPFCGSDNIEPEHVEPAFYVTCQGCRVLVTLNDGTDPDFNVEDAFEKWNRRA